MNRIIAKIKIIKGILSTASEHFLITEPAWEPHTIFLFRTLFFSNYLVIMNISASKFGDIAWAKVSGHPWWPCIVSNEPNLQNFTKKTRSNSSFYSKFFGCKEEFGRIAENNLIKFESLNKFRKNAEDENNKCKIKSNKDKFIVKYSINVDPTKKNIGKNT